MSPALSYTFKKGDGYQLALDVWLPEGVDGPTPAMVWFHGGGGFCGDKSPDKHAWFVPWMRDLIVKRNKWIHILPNYRLLTPTTAHDILDDTMDALDFVKNFLGNTPIANHNITVDPLRIAVGGESFGGYCAYLAGVNASPKPKAVVQLFGMGGQLLSPFYLEERGVPGSPYIMPFGQPPYPLPNPALDELFASQEVSSGTVTGFDSTGQPLHPRMAMFSYTIQRANFLDHFTGIQGFSDLLREHLDDAELSESALDVIDTKTRQVFPELFIDATFPPTFFMHGEKDSAVSIDQSRHVSKLLTDYGVDNVLIEYPGGEHGFDEGAQAVEGDKIFEKLKGVEPFLKKYLS